MSYAEIFAYVLNRVVQRINDERREGEAVVWGGDFNQALTGRDYVGTLSGRDALSSAFGQLGLQVPTRNLPALIEAHPAIDHIAVPRFWEISKAPRVVRPLHDGKPLSDHALYLVETGEVHSDFQ